MQEKSDRRYLSAQSYQALARRARELAALLKSHDLRIPEGSRFSKYIDILERVATFTGPVIPLKESAFALVAQAHHEVEQLHFVVSRLSGAPEVKGWKSEVQQVLSGSYYPQHERHPRRARNVQFQLYLTALSKFAGYEVEIAEPDSVIATTEFKFGIAAKRLRSVKHAHQALSKARKQIIRSGLPGIIALDVGEIHNPRNVILTVSDPIIATQKVTDAVDDFIHKNYEMISHSYGDNSVFGLLVYMPALFFVRASRQLGMTKRISGAHLCYADDPNAGRLGEYIARLLAATDVERGA